MSDNDCRLCVAIQSIAESDIVQEVVAKKELTLETMLSGMQDAVLLGWTLRDMQTSRAAADDSVCEQHREQVKALIDQGGESEEAPAP